VAAFLQASQPLTTPFSLFHFFTFHFFTFSLFHFFTFSLFHFFTFSLFTAVLARRRGNRAGDSGAGPSASRVEAEA
jgi:hypothetical protein